MAIGRHDLSLEAHSIQDLGALADTELLRDIRTATTHATTPTTTLPIVEIGRHDLSLEARSVQDLEAHADTELLRDIRTASVHGATAERCELTGGSLARGISGSEPGTEWDGAMRS